MRKVALRSTSLILYTRVLYRAVQYSCSQRQVTTVRSIPDEGGYDGQGESNTCTVLLYSTSCTVRVLNLVAEICITVPSAELAKEIQYSTLGTVPLYCTVGTVRYKYWPILTMLGKSSNLLILWRSSNDVYTYCPELTRIL